MMGPDGDSHGYGLSIPIGAVCELDTWYGQWVEVIGYGKACTI